MSYKEICRWLLLVLGLEGPKTDQVANQGWLLLASARPGATWRVVGGMLKPDPSWEILGKSETWAKMGCLYRKATVSMAWMGWQIGWGEVSGNQQSGENNVSQVDGVSDMAPACWLCVGTVQQRNNGLCQHFCLGKIYPPALSQMPGAWVPLCTYLPLHELLWIRLCPHMGPLRRITWDSRSTMSH